MSALFMEISGARRSLHVQVAQIIARKILSNELAEGETIPCEMELCEQFNVSRTALREAVKLLTSKGLLVSRPKIGTKVQPRSQWNFLDAQLLEWMDPNDSIDFHRQFLQLRQTIEPAASAKAAVNATAEQRVALSEAFQRMEATAATYGQPDWDETAWAEADLSFHRLLYVSTGNAFYIPFGNVLETMFRRFFAFSSQTGEFCLGKHRAVYEAIMAGDSERAHSTMAQLLNDDEHGFNKTMQHLQPQAS